MAIVQAICNSYKQEIMSGLHLAAHDYYMALFLSTATLDKNTTTYTGLLNEVPLGGNYTIGGKLLVGFATSLDGDVAILTFTSPVVWATATFTARAALIYNHTLAGKNAIAVLDFGSDFTATAGDFSITLPTADATHGLIRIS